MGQVIRLDAARVVRNAPDADCVGTDPYGQKMFLYAFEYRMDGKVWALPPIWASSQDDAERRVLAMRESMVCLGQIKAQGSL